MRCTVCSISSSAPNADVTGTDRMKKTRGISNLRTARTGNVYEIIRKEEMANGSVIRFDIRAPNIADKIKPGQFVIIRTHEGGERIPLTVADKDSERGTIAIIFQVVGKTTALMRSLDRGDGLRDVAGPLGLPSDLKNVGTAVVVGGGTGVAILHHITKGLRESGNRIVGIIGAKSSDFLILKDEMEDLCDELIITTDDGSVGIHGFVTQPLEELLKSGEEINEVFAIGPIVMMKNVASLTKPYGIKTVVSLNPVMIDGTGMCGCCRVIIDGKMKFCCVDGPEFDGHTVDFEKLMLRNSMFQNEERESILSSISLRGH
ncbi:MAG: sulfide/dihydroorotate dehydrogenase-like FAD/NAD-binding protein [Thermoplasmatota archaeon]